MSGEVSGTAARSGRSAGNPAGKLILIVTSSPENRTVLEESLRFRRFRTHSIVPAGPVEELSDLKIALAVIDETAGSTAPNPVLDALLGMREGSADGLPRILVIARRKPYDGSVKVAMAADAIIDLPLVPEKIQHAVANLMGVPRLH